MTIPKVGNWNGRSNKSRLVEFVKELPTESQQFVGDEGMITRQVDRLRFRRHLFIQCPDRVRLNIHVGAPPKDRDRVEFSPGSLNVPDVHCPFYPLRHAVNAWKSRVRKLLRRARLTKSPGVRST